VRPEATNGNSKDPPDHGLCSYEIPDSVFPDFSPVAYLNKTIAPCSFQLHVTSSVLSLLAERSSISKIVCKFWLLSTGTGVRFVPCFELRRVGPPRMKVPSLVLGAHLRLPTHT